MMKTLIEHDAVPQGSFYLAATENVLYIDNKYQPYIQV